MFVNQVKAPQSFSWTCDPDRLLDENPRFRCLRKSPAFFGPAPEQRLTSGRLAIISTQETWKGFEMGYFRSSTDVLLAIRAIEWCFGGIFHYSSVLNYNNINVSKIPVAFWEISYSGKTNVLWSAPRLKRSIILAWIRAIFWLSFKFIFLTNPILRFVDIPFCSFTVYLDPRATILPAWRSREFVRPVTFFVYNPALPTVLSGGLRVIKSPHLEFIALIRAIKLHNTG